ncbi:hypothetical protein [Andreprevotia chitinilytica]|uniref:hypothetical protein n=1 Tax=Andreprevotia chitinilytica TaxID=396808 RepID=UPI0005569C26|nr:hypothetical protein [Andreprevotia chitinilytica]
MAFYWKADQVPELQGLSRWEQRVLLRGTFLKERMISSLILLVVALGSVWGVIAPLLAKFAPGVQRDSFLFFAVMIVWLLVLIGLRDVVMMNILRPKIAAKRAAKVAAEVAQLEREGD